MARENQRSPKLADTPIDPLGYICYNGSVSYKLIDNGPARFWIGAALTANSCAATEGVYTQHGCDSCRK